MFTALLRTCQVHLACDRHRHWDSLPSLYKTRCIPSFRSVSSRITAVHIEVHLFASQCSSQCIVLSCDLYCVYHTAKQFDSFFV